MFTLKTLRQQLLRNVSTKKSKPFSVRFEKFESGFKAGWWLGGIGTTFVYISEKPLAADGGLLGFALGASTGAPLGGLLNAFPKSTILSIPPLVIGWQMYRNKKKRIDNFEPILYRDKTKKFL